MAGKAPKFESVANNSQKIRNISLIGDTNHGKTTLYNIFENMHNFSADQEPTVLKTTLTPAFASRFTQPSDDFEECLVNLFDTPGHFDFELEVASCIRLCDGVILVIDCTEGILLQTESLIKQALKERVRICLVINKIDLLLANNTFTVETIYARFCDLIDKVNRIIVENQTKGAPEQYLSAVGCNVAFTSLKNGWGFTLHQICKLYGKKTLKKPDKIMPNLWGNRFVNKESNKIVEDKGNNLNKEQWVRGCCKYVLGPIKRVYECSSEKSTIQGLVQRIGLQLDVEELLLQNEEELIARIMRNWMPVNETLMELMIDKIPSPKESQRYKLTALYPPDSLEENAKEGLETCDCTSQLELNFTQRVPNTSGRLVVGRVFSGSISAGDLVYILTGNKPEQIITHIYLNTPQLMRIARAVAGSVIVIKLKGDAPSFGTLSGNPNAVPMKGLIQLNPPTLQQYIEPNSFNEFPKCKEALTTLVKTMPFLSAEYEDQFYFNCNSPFHADIILNELKAQGLNENVKREALSVCYCETVTKESPECLTKSPNKHNRLYGKCSVLDERIQEALLEERIDFRNSPKGIALQLQNISPLWNEKDWNIVTQTGLNLFINNSRGQYFNEIKDACLLVFNTFSTQGILMNDPVTGFAFHLLDFSLFFDAIHRSSTQVIPAFRRLLSACELQASPRLLQPIYLIEFVVLQTSLERMKHNLIPYDWRFCEEVHHSDLHTRLIGYLPLRGYLDLENTLKALDDSIRITFMKLYKWELIDSDPLLEGSEANIIVKQRRRIKGLQEAIPPLAKFVDKL